MTFDIASFFAGLSAASAIFMCYFSRRDRLPTTNAKCIRYGESGSVLILIEASPGQTSVAITSVSVDRGTISLYKAQTSRAEQIDVFWRIPTKGFRAPVQNLMWFPPTSSDRDSRFIKITLKTDKIFFRMSHVLNVERTIENVQTATNKPNDISQLRK